MSSGEKPIGAAKGKQPDTNAPPPPPQYGQYPLLSRGLLQG